MKADTGNKLNIKRTIKNVREMLKSYKLLFKENISSAVYGPSFKNGPSMGRLWAVHTTVGRLANNLMVRK